MDTLILLTRDVTGEVSESGSNAGSASESESEQETFHDEYDENLYGDEEDRKRLEQMTEKEREQELFNRGERRQALKTRLDIRSYYIIFPFLYIYIYIQIIFLHETYLVKTFIVANYKVQICKTMKILSKFLDPFTLTSGLPFCFFFSDFQKTKCLKYYINFDDKCMVT